MSKPLHAGHAASQGLIAAALAREGFASRREALECADGFAAMQGGEDSLVRMAAALNSQGALDPNFFHTRSINFKFYASCYGTHGPIESALGLRAQLGGTLPDSLAVNVEPQYMSVCNIATPSSALDAKFSIRHTVALTLLGHDLADGNSFSNAMIADPMVADLRERISVASDAGLKRATARIEARLPDGTTLSAGADVSQVEADLARQGQRIEAKFAACARDSLTGNGIAGVIDLCRKLEQVTDVTELVSALR